MDPGPPLLQPIEDSELMTGKNKRSGNTTGDQSPQMPTLFQADREPGPLLNMQDIFSVLTDYDLKDKDISPRVTDVKHDSDSLFERMFKDYGNINFNEQSMANESMDNNQSVTEKKPLPDAVIDDDKKSNDTSNELKVNNTSEVKGKKQLSKSSKVTKVVLKKRKKQKPNNFNDYVDEEDLRKMGIKTKIKGCSKDMNNEKDNSISANTQIESKHLRSPYITLRNQSPRKNLKSVNIISTEYEIINPALRSGVTESSYCVFRPNMKSILANQFNSDYPAICVFCGQKPDFLELGFLFGPYFLEKDFLIGINNIFFFPTDFSLSSQTATNNDNSKISKSSSRNSRKSQSTDDFRLTANGEVWFHRECILWAPGTYLCGDGNIGGLGDAVKMALSAECFHCQKVGAILNCTTKNCERNFHYYCATSEACQLNEEQFSLICNKHCKSR